MYKKYFSKFLTANEHRLHFAGHSHHYWPDITKKAQEDYWLDSMNLVDDKWGKIFGTKIVQTQKHIANILKIKNYQNIAFAPNTHELVYRIISSIEKDGPINILSTDSEFYSFERQALRLEESNELEVKRVPSEPFNDFTQRFSDESKKSEYDIIFVSQVFFNNSYAINDLLSFVNSLDQKPLIVIDGYHSFMAIDVDLSELEDKIFYLSGSYKYAGGGEGCCFSLIPKDCKLRPKFTGWFAEMSELSNKDPKKVSYQNDGMRFAGSTMDFTSLYRLESWLKLREDEGITVKAVSDHVKNLQNLFIKETEMTALAQYLVSDTLNCGNFLVYRLPSVEITTRVVEYLRDKNIMTDSRKNILRFGISMYLDEQDIRNCAKVISQIEGVI